jgi:hypothetical protein
MIVSSRVVIIRRRENLLKGGETIIPRRLAESQLNTVDKPMFAFLVTLGWPQKTRPTQSSARQPRGSLRSSSITPLIMGILRVAAVPSHRQAWGAGAARHMLYGSPGLANIRTGEPLSNKYRRIPLRPDIFGCRHKGGRHLWRNRPSASGTVTDLLPQPSRSSTLVTSFAAAAPVAELVKTNSRGPGLPA